MFVVERIEKSGYASTIEKLNFKNVVHRVYFNELGSLKEVASGARDDDKLVAVYKAVVDFIQWYNKQKK